jgi:endoglucanase
LSKSKNIPIHIGEFGAYSKADMESRVKWTRFLSRWFEQQEFSWAYWEWNSGFGIYDPQTKIYKTELINALIKEAIPPVQTVN